MKETRYAVIVDAGMQWFSHIVKINVKREKEEKYYAVEEGIDFPFTIQNDFLKIFSNAQLTQHD